ncbi:uncharacterized [Tachysurus ichikawai]
MAALTACSLQLRLDGSALRCLSRSETPLTGFASNPTPSAAGHSASSRQASLISALAHKLSSANLTHRQTNENGSGTKSLNGLRMKRHQAKSFQWTEKAISNLSQRSGEDMRKSAQISVSSALGISEGTDRPELVADNDRGGEEVTLLQREEDVLH